MLRRAVAAADWWISVGVRIFGALAFFDGGVFSFRDVQVAHSQDGW
jgi:hypothetical protein